MQYFLYFILDSLSFSRYFPRMDTLPPNPTRRAFRRYLLEFSLAMAAYVATIFLSRWLLRGPLRTTPEPWASALALLPLLSVIALFLATFRLVLATDEFQRRIYIESFAIAGGATALLAITYGLLEGEHFPHLSAWWTYTAFMLAWLLATFILRWRYR